MRKWVIKIGNLSADGLKTTDRFQTAAELAGKLTRPESAKYIPIKWKRKGQTFICPVRLNIK